MKKIYILLGLALLASCTTDKTPVSPDYQHDFAIFMVDSTAEEKIEYGPILFSNDQAKISATKLSLEDLPLEATPIFTGKDIQIYDASAHVLVLKPGYNLPFFSTDYKTIQLYQNRSFVVIAGSERIYRGYFHTINSSWPPKSPFILVGYPGSEFSTAYIRFWKQSDTTTYVLDDIRIKKTLELLDVYSRGISVHVDSVSVINNGSEAKVNANLSILNNGPEPLWVLDPQKTDVCRFYGNSINLLLIRNEMVTPLRQPCKQRIDDWTFDWYTRLGPNKSLTRSITYHTEAVPAGEYQVGFDYQCPQDISLDDLYIDGARVWMGAVYTMQYYPITVE